MVFSAVLHFLFSAYAAMSSANAAINADAVCLPREIIS
jgi:hypothetical protein